jgi:hypothetical protein
MSPLTVSNGIASLDKSEELEDSLPHRKLLGWDANTVLPTRFSSVRYPCAAVYHYDLLISVLIVECEVGSDFGLVAVGDTSRSIGLSSSLEISARSSAVISLLI